MKKRKLFTICSLLIVTIFSLFVGACKSNTSTKINPTITMPEKELILDKSEVSILLGESDYILVETVGMDADTSIAFTSSNESVATVNDIGVIQAKNVGTTTITVEADGVKESCAVNVTLGSYLPEISLKQIDGDSAIIGTDGALNFDPIVIFNHQEYTNATYTYQVEDTTIGAVQNGIFTATGNIGSTFVTVYANWCGLSGETMITLQKKVTVTVAVPIIELYTRANFEGKEYATSANLADVIDDENATDIQASVIAGNDIVNISNGIITPNTYGKASISISYKDGAAQTVEKKFDVTVQRPTAEYEEEINFSILDGDIPVTTIWGNQAEIVEAYVGTPTDKGESLTMTNGKITAGISLRNNASECKTITLLTETEGYIVDLRVYTKLIDEVGDLEMFTLIDRDITGAYLVTKDLDARELSPIQHSGFENATTGYIYKFTGVFDGGGHTVTVNVKNGGLFGKLSKATIINTNFVLNISGTTHGAGNNPTGLAHSATDTTISNVYVELNPVAGLTVASNRTWALSLIGNASTVSSGYLKTENVVVVNNDDFENLQANTEKGWVGGAFIYADGGRASAAMRDKEMKNVFVIAPERLGNGYYVPMAGGTARQTFACNDETGKADATEKTGQSQYTYGNVTRYTTLKELCASGRVESLPKHMLKKIAQTAVVVEIGGNVVQDGAELESGVWTAVQLKVGETIVSNVRLQSSDPSIASVNNSEIKVDGFTTATITATGNVFGVEITTAFSVVMRVEAYAEEQLFSSVDGDVDMKTIFGDGAILSNAYGIDGTNYTVDNGKITDLTNVTGTAQTKTLILETSNHQLKKVTFKVYTKLLDEAEDLAVFQLTDKDITGCYLVVKDIDASEQTALNHTDLTVKDNAYDFDYKFKGTFDGSGHTVKANVSYGGLFGELNEATITNTNFVFNIGGNSSSLNNSGFRPTGLAYTALNSTISNVYAELNVGTGLASGREWAVTLVMNAPNLNSGYLNLENVVVVNNDDFANLTVKTEWCSTGALFYADSGRAFNTRDKYMTNVFVVAPKTFGANNSGYVAMASGTAQASFASNDMDSKQAVDDMFTTPVYTLAATRYSTVQEFVSSNVWKDTLPEFIMNAVRANNAK